MNDPFKIVSDNTGIWDAQSGEWFDYNEPLPEHDPYWAYAQIGEAYRKAAGLPEPLERVRA